ncbi:hypothetical protein DY000_02039573 [Brassica cretica]|uniref:Uncharacterized protein n=1 Tax=Brassica cretica TaxID=69181 RepID=A0ABQ7BF23_BRACR|nr:hypothetical protein DY000_02039573 [Brassica cretica]
MQQGHTATDDDLEQFNLEYCRNQTTKKTSNGRELKRAGVEVARADRCPGCKLRMDGAEAVFV